MPKTETIEACARAAHEVNRAYCLAMGDTSQPSWEEAPEWQRSSAIAGVEGALAGNTPEQSHEGWFEEKRRTGWTHGPVKNPELREHPCMVPYAELPPAQRAKDALFVTTVRAIAGALEPDDLPKRMYEAYVANAGGVNFQGNPCPKWEELPAQIHSNWGAAARVGG